MTATEMLARMLPELELEARLRRVLDRTTFFPDEDFLRRFPHGRQLVESAASFGGISAVYDRLGRDYFQSRIVPIPSPEQRLAGIEIALAGKEGRKRFELSEPGTRKTIGVLSAIPIINEVLLPEMGYVGQRVKTLVCSPTYVLPTWIREAERLLKDPHIVVLTRQNRRYALKQAAQDDVDLVLLGYELSHRRTGIDFQDPEVIEDMQERSTILKTSVFSPEAAYALLEKVMPPEKFAKYAHKKKSLDAIIERIIIEEKNTEAASIAGALQQKVFTADGQPYYAVYDEIHNVIDPDSATAMALSGLFRAATWGALVTGTAARNRLSNLAYIAYLAGRTSEPGDFSTVFRDNPKIIGSMFDLDSNAIRKLKDVDGNISDPEYKVVEYSLSSKEMDIYVAITNSPIFEGKDQYLLLNYLLTNPAKLLPDHFPRSDAPDSLRVKVEQFFAENPEFAKYCQDITPSKLRVVKGEIEKAVAEGRKVVVACEFSSNLTEFLEREFADYGCVRIDQTVSAQMRSPSLPSSEIEHLRSVGLYDGQRLRCDLSLAARVALNIDTRSIYEPSERQLALLEFQTNPDKSVLVTTYGTLREGTDVQEASVLVEYENTTVPFKFWQMLARLLRSGQQEVVRVIQPRGVHTLEESKYEFRNWKDYVIRLIFDGDDATPEELEAFFTDQQAEKSVYVGHMLKMNSRATVALMFNYLRGAGVDRFVQEMSVHDNALFLAKNYNYQWAYSYSANCARLVNEIVLGLENRIGKGFQDIIDEGAGPTTIARVLDRAEVARRVTSLDINKFQLDYGIDACKEAGISNDIYVLGSYTNLRNVIPLDQHLSQNVSQHGDQQIGVFDPREAYREARSIDNISQDLAVCSLALDFATEEERKYFFRENKRVLRLGGYLMIVNPTSKIDPSCREDFLQDVEVCGFEVDRTLTGTYKSRHTLNVDTGEAQKVGFEAYVVVARKIDDVEITFGQGRTYFRMMQGYTISDGGRNRDDIEKAIREGKGRRYECKDFYNADTGVDPKALDHAGINPPLHPDLGREIVDAIAQTPTDELERLAKALDAL
ncbi:MAG TPA: hypothetical protein VJI15_05925 [Candidatus Nanoarchaeia archaeon]|nr:hypothetical protein [Candidatus Nanoarchaeia archaeon]